MIGVTLIALGTSLPELVTNVLAVINQDPASSRIVLGNVVGSNIANLCLVLGVIGAIGGQIDLHFDVMKVDLPMLMGATFLLVLTIMDKHFSSFEGILFLLALTLYVIYILNLGKESNPGLKMEVEQDASEKFSWKEPVILLIAVTVIYFSAYWNVESIRELSQRLGIGTELIAETALALGTSLPELVVSVVAIRTNNGEMAVGNILGSNIFNIFAVIGIPSMFGHIAIADSTLYTSIPILVAASFLAFFVIQDKKINRWESWMLLLFYLFFLGTKILA